MRYTREMLAALATAAGYEISERTVKDWDARGFLPQPSNERVGESARGRAPASYPEGTQVIVLWLARHRRFIEGEGAEDAVKLWLWMNGLYTRDLDVRALLLARIARLWAVVRAELPTVGTLGDSGPLDAEKSLDLLDTTVTAPRLESGAWDEEQAGQVSLFACLVGLLSPTQFDKEPEPHTDVLLTQDAPCLEQLQEALPSLLQGGQLRFLYRMLSEGIITDDMLKMLPEFWQSLDMSGARGLFPFLSPTVTKGLSLETPDDLMRLCSYEPLAPLMLLSMVAFASMPDLGKLASEFEKRE